MDEMNVTLTPKRKKTAAKRREPAFRKALERAVGFAGGIRPLAKRTRGKLPLATLAHLLRHVQVMTTKQAILVEQATGGAINRLEFFPELIHGNEERAIQVVHDMTRSK